MREDEGRKFQLSVQAVCGAVKKLAEHRNVDFNYNLWVGHFEREIGSFGLIVNGISELLLHSSLNCSSVVFKLEIDSYGIEVNLYLSHFQQKPDFTSNSLQQLSSFVMKEDAHDQIELFWQFEFDESDMGQIPFLVPPFVEMEHYRSRYFNFEPLMASINNNLNALSEIITLFMDKIPSEIQTIQTSINLNDRKMISFVSARLKASCQYMGLRLLASFAEMLQNATLAGAGFSELETLSLQIEKAYYETAAKMNEFLKQQGF